MVFYTTSSTRNAKPRSMQSLHSPRVRDLTPGVVTLHRTHNEHDCLGATLSYNRMEDLTDPADLI